MNFSNPLEKRKMENKDIRFYVEEAKKTCQFFFNTQYTYSKDNALEALGVEPELIDQLLEDFVVQIIQSNKILREYLDNLKSDEYNNSKLDFTPFKELVHKNLGVARNLRIEDSEKILKRLMETENTEEIDILLDVLEACVILLLPIKSYNTLQEININN